MSGYRSLHRETIGRFPIWQVSTSPLLVRSSAAALRGGAAPRWRVWCACGDGLVRGFVVQEKTVDMQKDVLDASACSCTCTHVLRGSDQQQEKGSSSPALGCSSVQHVRIYSGDDDMAGDVLLASMDLSGKLRIWILPQDMDEAWLKDDAPPPQTTVSDTVAECPLPDATGTFFQLCPPATSGTGDIVMAVPCLDGTISIVATGTSTPKSKKEPSLAGSVLETWSKPGSKIALNAAWHPSKKQLVVGRQDGLVELLGDKTQRMILHETPVRCVDFTPDGHLLLTGSDDGVLAVWDVSRPKPTLVHHVVSAHQSWILSSSMLSDSKRFLSCGADRKISVWTVGQLDQAMHSFSCDDTVWTTDTIVPYQAPTSSRSKNVIRFVTGSETGMLQIYSLES